MLVAGLLGAGTAPAEARTVTPQVAYHRWSSTKALAAGTTSGTRVASGSVRLARATKSVSYQGHWYDAATWTSHWTSAGFGADSLVASWNAITPTGTWLKVQVRGRTTTGRTGSWDTVAYWASGDSRIKRASRSSQSDDYARVATDTVVLNGTSRYSTYKVRAVLLRPRGSSTTPRLDSIGVVASANAKAARRTSTTTMTRTTELAVPRYSQMIHAGEYPAWDGGGEAWCSPTSTTMVLRYFGSGPTKGQYAWVRPSYKNRFVDHAARYTYDHRYEGTGNWAFNTAYAGTFGMDAFVTRMTGLRDAEAFIKAGIPVVASIAFSRGGLSGAPISVTSGHLLVISGFTKAGNVIVRDPAGSNKSAVRRVYDRGQLERAWVKGSGGTAYVIRPAAKKLPKGAGSSRW